MSREEAKKRRDHYAECQQGQIRSEQHAIERLQERFITDRIPANARMTQKNISTQCLHVSKIKRSLNVEEYAEKLKLASYQVFTLILQEITGTTLLYESEAVQLKHYYDRLKQGAHPKGMYFKHVERTEEEIISLYENAQVFTMKDFVNFKDIASNYLAKVAISEEEFNSIISFYQDRIKFIKDNSSIVNNKFVINDFAGFDKLTSNINEIKSELFEKELVLA